MIRFISALTRLRAALLLLALVAIVVRGLVPIGFMPGSQQEAGTTLVICSGVDTQTIYLDENGQPATPDDAHDKSSPCVFSFAPLAFEPFLPEIVQIAFDPVPVPVSLILATEQGSLSSSPYSSRAPPSSLV